MTRCKVKSRFIIKWAIRSQTPTTLKGCAVHRLDGGWYYYKLLAFSIIMLKV
jgi:hypothetical protein